MNVSIDEIDEGAVSILDAETHRDVTYYTVLVALKNGNSWKVSRRYTNFKDLHDKLMSMLSLGADSCLLNLPPKQINKNDPRIVKQRQQELQEYLRSVILNLVPPYPKPLYQFLTHNFYDFRNVEDVVRLKQFPSSAVGGVKCRQQLDAFGMPSFADALAGTGGSAEASFAFEEAVPATNSGSHLVFSGSVSKKNLLDSRHIPKFAELHSKHKNHMQETYAKSKADVAQSTVFVDDLISF